MNYGTVTLNPLEYLLSRPYCQPLLAGVRLAAVRRERSGRRDSAWAIGGSLSVRAMVEDEEVTCLNRRQQREPSEGKLAKRQSESQQRRRWKAALDLYLWGGHSCPPPLTPTFLWPRSNSKAGQECPPHI